MTIWLLAVVLVLSLAGLGYRQGAIRAGFSLFGILCGALLALPLAKPAAILLKAFGVVNPVVLWLVPPFIVFCAVSALFKGAAQFVHHKVEVYFKYKAGDLRLSLWERMNRRVGLCVGILNATAYLVLISFVILILSYWTVQMDSPSESRKMVQLVNRLGRDLQLSGFIKTARAIDRMPDNYYKAADVLGLLYQNPLLEARLSRYPAFLMLGERQEFQSLARDAEFSSMRARLDSFSQIYAHEPVRQIAANPEMLRLIWGIVEPDLEDLNAYLNSKAGDSQKYDPEVILGRWICNQRGTLAVVRRAKPNMTAQVLQQERMRIQALFGRTRMVIGPEKELMIKEFPNFRGQLTPSGTLEMLSMQGSWSGANGHYEVSFPLGGTNVKGTVIVDNNRLSLTVEKMTLVFDKEY